MIISIILIALMIPGCLDDDPSEDEADEIIDVIDDPVDEEIIISGIVIDSETGQPLSGCEVILGYMFGVAYGVESVTTYTGTDGKWIFEDVKNESDFQNNLVSNIRIFVSKDHFFEKSVELDLNKDHENLTISLEAGGYISGRISNYQSFNQTVYVSAFPTIDDLDIFPIIVDVDGNFNSSLKKTGYYQIIIGSEWNNITRPTQVVVERHSSTDIQVDYLAEPTDYILFINISHREDVMIYDDRPHIDIFDLMLEIVISLPVLGSNMTVALPEGGIYEIDVYGWRDDGSYTGNVDDEVIIDSGNNYVDLHIFYCALP